jgi:hypothetical protein
MTPEAEIFNKINQRPEFGYSGIQISTFSGLDKSLISRFLAGKTDISASRFTSLIKSMPRPFQKAYWAEIIGTQIQQEATWSALISQASITDIEEILTAIAGRWAEREKPNKPSEELASV